MKDHEGQFAEEFEKLCQSKQQIILELTPLQAWVLMAQLQLALRHPLNRNASSKIAHELATRLQGKVAPGGALAEIAERGWRPEEDYVERPRRAGEAR